jgi:rod shape-determining protein MreD
VTAIAAPAAKAAVLFFFVTIVQVTIVSEIGILGGSPDLVLVTLVAVALTQGSIFGAFCGFWAGLLIDTATLGTLGFTSLLLTLAGFWIGRYGETTGRDRAHAPLLSVAVVTVLYAAGSLVMHFLLREPAPAQVVLFEELPGTIALNLLLTLPVFALVRRLFAAPERTAPEVEFVG